MTVIVQLVTFLLSCAFVLRVQARERVENDHLGSDKLYLDFPIHTHCRKLQIGALSGLSQNPDPKALTRDWDGS